MGDGRVELGVAHRLDPGLREAAIDLVHGGFLPARTGPQPEDRRGDRLPIIARCLPEQALGYLGVGLDVPGVELPRGSTCAASSGR